MGEMPPFVAANLPAPGEPWAMIIERHDATSGRELGRLDVRSNILDRRAIAAFLRASADNITAGDRGIDLAAPPTLST